ncbi:MAG: 4Fe-4S ferredoxin, partial [Euryarchaeota archaeon]|nr:4Fe-4S ferredoxin [Euryarchaeota archaeon]
KAFVEINNCFGCGLCASGCGPGAVKLMDRRSTPARAIW